MKMVLIDARRGLAVALLAVAASAAHARDAMHLVIGSGPHAGTYQREEGKSWFVGCGRFPPNPQLSAIFKDMNPTMKAKGAAPDQLLSVGFNVFNPDGAGAKQGGIIVQFGDGKSETARYQVMVPEDSKGPLVMTRNGKALALSFDGATRDGVKLRLKFECEET